jgi:uncharacterized protein YgbK (DUF1537 family)
VKLEWVIQADDLTGAADTAAGFATAGMRTLVLPWGGALPERPPATAVLAVDTASRDLEPATAARRAGEVAAWFTGHCDRRAWFYKKIDSTLRGNPAAELSAVEVALCGSGRPPPVTVIVPAFPALGRTTVGGHQRWDGGDVDLVRMFGASGEAGVPRTVLDAANRRDLEVLSGALERFPVRPLLVGSGGLAAAHAARRRPRGQRATVPPASSGPLLLVVGSRTALTARQVAVLRRRADSLTTVAVDDGQRDGSAGAAALARGGDVLLTGPVATLARAAARALDAATPRLVLVVGGDTALALCGALGLETLEVEGQAAPGAPVLRARTADDRMLRILTRSGSFGGDEALADLAARA